jgi:uncharacterized membrane protein YphA (DoxX/SURF4 family)
MEKKPISHLVAGVIVAGLMIIYSMILYFTGMDSNRPLSYVSFGILIIGIIFFVRAFGKANNDHKSFGNLFAYGFKTSAFAALVVVAFNVVFNLVFPEFKEKFLDVMRQNMETQGKLTEDHISSYIDGMKKYYQVIMIAGAVFMFAVFGAIGSAIGAAMTKKDVSDSPFENLQ